MKCPVCPDSQLQMTERQGVEIDYCPQCRGVWLDRGELDKLIERSTAASVSSGYPRRDEHHASGHGGHGYDHRRKKSWLSEIFD